MVIVLGQGSAIELPETMDVQAIRQRRRAQLEPGFQTGQTGGGLGPGAQIDGRRVVPARQGGAMRGGEKNHLRCQRHQFLEKLRLGRHPDGMARPAFFKGKQQGKGKDQVPHALQLQNQQGIRAHERALPTWGVP